ncbi:MAG: bifunctional oligoribonuclease/PAP phosphatase NrnA [Lachnospiraceae bacterium]|nr:bifunctional oligoribonuclease/PAP phosphatase NrnA [Lachnospiraceae bacterium]
MAENYEIISAIETAQRVGIAGHIRPDGDCVGSTLAMYNYITANFDCDVDLHLEEVPACFRILAGAEDANPLYPDTQPYDVFIAIDCGDIERLGKADKYLKAAKRSFCIDHHQTNTGYADVNIIKPDAAASAELLFDLFDPQKVNKQIAECLYLGIVHDTGVFKHSNTTRHTMEVAGRLLEYGVSSSKIIDGTFYEKTYLQNQILGRCLMESVLVLDGKVIFSAVNRKIQAFYGLEPSDTEGVIDQLRVTKGVEVAILIKEMNPQVWRVSMRSCEYVNVADICSKYGGGGHIRAAGCIINGSMHDVINALTKEIEMQMKPVQDAGSDS